MNELYRTSNAFRYGVWGAAAGAVLMTFAWGRAAMIPARSALQKTEGTLAEWTAHGTVKRGYTNATFDVLTAAGEKKSFYLSYSEITSKDYDLKLQMPVTVEASGREPCALTVNGKEIVNYDRWLSKRTATVRGFQSFGIVLLTLAIPAMIVGYMSANKRSTVSATPATA